MHETMPPAAVRTTDPLPAVSILGLPVHVLTMECALAAIDGFVRSGKPHHVITADASMLVTAQEDSELHRIVSEAGLVTPDSAGVLWASKQYGKPMEERVSGVEIVERLCEASPRAGYRLFFFGAAPGIAEQAADRMRRKYPGARIVGARDGFFKPEQTVEIVQQIRSCRPDILCVALGIPKQEKWIAANKAALGVSVLIGVGGTFDVLSGTVRRAPRLFQKLHLEWLWRVVSNPRKIGKVMLLPRFVLLVRKAKRLQA